MHRDTPFGPLVGLGVVVALVGYAFVAPGGPGAREASARLTVAGSAAPAVAAFGFPDCEAMARQMTDLTAARVDAIMESRQFYNGPYGAVQGGSEQLSGLGMGGSPAPPARVPAVGTEPTGTNVAERGVDEPDVAKVDGTRVLRLWGSEDRTDGDDHPGHPSLAAWELAIIDASGERPRRLGALRPATDVDAIEMLLLDDHKVLLIGSVEEGSPRTGDDELWTPKVVLTLVDTADAAHPKVLRTAKLTGRYVSARLRDGVVRVVFATPPPLTVTPAGESETLEQAAARNMTAVRSYEPENWLPAREILDGDGRVVSAGPAMDCRAVHPPVEPDGPDLVSVLTLDTRAGAEALDASAVRSVLGGADLVYASSRGLYIAAQEWGEGGWDDRPGGDEAGDAIEAVTLHAFGTTGRTDTIYGGATTVPGRLLGPSALSEHGGHLRVALTEGQEQASRSGIVVFAPDSGRLRQVGRVTGLGRGEEIRSVRWAGDLATVVTYRQTDPFYVLDLTRPTAPTLLGELKIPGYSGYLHPVGGSTVLGVGQAGDDGGRLTGVQVSAFDVSDPGSPVRRATLGLGRGQADAEADSRMFTYLPDSRTAVVIGWQRQRRDEVPMAVGVEVDPSGRLRELGRFYADAAVLRVLPVGGRLAAVTGSSVVLLDPTDMRPTGSVVLDPSYDGGPPDLGPPRPPSWFGCCPD